MADAKARQLKKEFLRQRARKAHYRREVGFYMAVVNEQHTVVQEKLRELRLYLIEQARTKARS